LLKIAGSATGAIIEIRLIPRASRTAIEGVRDGALLVRTVAAPVDGAANDALLSLLARSLQVPRRALAIVSGERTRRKRVAVQGLSPDVLASRVAGLVGPAAG
jgi:uncharacterized protein YggU (UPF0235/DUF167 family)